MTTKADYVALQAELDEEWEAAPEFRPLDQHLPVSPDANRSFWAWFDAHPGEVVLRKRLMVFVVTVQLRHLRRMFEAVFGPHP